MQTVKLKNGAQVPLSLISVINMGVNNLTEKGLAVPLYEAVQLARNPQHKLFGNSDEHLTALGWLDAAGKMHRAVADVLQSMAQGDGLTMTFGDPRADYITTT